MQQEATKETAKIVLPEYKLEIPLLIKNVGIEYGAYPIRINATHPPRTHIDDFGESFDVFKGLKSRRTLESVLQFTDEEFDALGHDTRNLAGRILHVTLEPKYHEKQDPHTFESYPNHPQALAVHNPEERKSLKSGKVKWTAQFRTYIEDSFGSASQKIINVYLTQEQYNNIARTKPEVLYALQLKVGKQTHSLPPKSTL